MYMKSRGYTPEQVLGAVQQVERAMTPDGAREIVDVVRKTHGAAIAQELLASIPDEVLKGLDSKARRSIRRAVARRDEGADYQDPDTGDDDAPNPAVEAKAAAEAARKDAGEARQLAMTTAEAVSLAPKLVSFMSRNPIAAAHAEEWQAQVIPLLKSGHPRYQGPEGIAHASEDVVNDWRRRGEMAGLKAEAAPSPNARGGIPSHKDEDIVKRLQEARTKGKAELLKEANALGMDLL
jgi:hypothetical protein